MPSYYLLQVADDGTPTVTELTDPVTVTEAVTIPLASLLPAPVEQPPADPAA